MSNGNRQESASRVRPVEGQRQGVRAAGMLRGGDPLKPSNVCGIDCPVAFGLRPGLLIEHEDARVLGLRPASASARCYGVWHRQDSTRPDRHHGPAAGSALNEASDRHTAGSQTDTAYATEEAATARP